MTNDDKDTVELHVVSTKELLKALAEAKKKRDDELRERGVTIFGEFAP